jgi:hypothetical protein
MPDANIKQVKIAKNILDTSSPQGKYKLRYRVVSSTNNDKSTWSQYIELVPSKSILQITGAITPTYTFASSFLTVTWDMPASTPVYVKKYDVYIQWSTATVSQDWIYAGQATLTNAQLSYKAQKPSTGGITKGRAAVFAATYPKLTNAEINAASTLGNNGYMNLVFNNTTYFAV